MDVGDELRLDNNIIPQKLYNVKFWWNIMASGVYGTMRTYCSTTRRFYGSKVKRGF